MGVRANYPHKTICRNSSNGINLVHDDSETCLPHLQKQRMRQLLPLPGRSPKPHPRSFKSKGDDLWDLAEAANTMRSAPRAPAPLFQIKSGFRARWNAIDFSVEADSDQWTLLLKIPSTAKCCTRRIGAGRGRHSRQPLDFASFRLACDSHCRAAKELKWQAYW